MKLISWMWLNIVRIVFILCCIMVIYHYCPIMTNCWRIEKKWSWLGWRVKYLIVLSLIELILCGMVHLWWCCLAYVYEDVCVLWLWLSRHRMWSKVISSCLCIEMWYEVMHVSLEDSMNNWSMMWMRSMIVCGWMKYDHV